MYRVTVEEMRRVYKADGATTDEKEWIVTHQMTVPDAKTLSTVMEATAATIGPERR